MWVAEEDWEFSLRMNFNFVNHKGHEGTQRKTSLGGAGARGYSYELKAKSQEPKADFGRISDHTQGKIRD